MPKPENKGYRTRNPFKSKDEQDVDLSEGDSENDDPSIVWRGLKKEDVDPVMKGLGITATKLNSGEDEQKLIKDHIEHGSEPDHSCPFISASRSKKVSARYASDKLSSQAPDPSELMVKIKLNKKIKSVDLTDPYNLKRANLSPAGKKFAENSQEVLIFGKIPAENIIGVFSVKSLNAPWDKDKYGKLKAEKASGLLRFRAYEKPKHRGYQVTKVQEEDDPEIGALNIDDSKDEQSYNPRLHNHPLTGRR